MQKLILSLFVILLSVLNLTAQNQFENPSFETGWSTGGMFTTVSKWTSTPGSLIQETSIVSNGSYAAKITGANNVKFGNSTENFYPTPGTTYALSFDYYLLQSQGANDIQLNCAWSGPNSSHDATVLKEAFTAPSTGAWYTKTILTTAPSGASYFDFEAKIPNGAIVIFDNFSLAVNVSSATPSLVVNPTTLSAVSTTVGTPVNFQTLVITTANLTGNVDIYIGGTNRTLFSLSTDVIPAGQTSTTLTVTYSPTAASTNHTATLNFDPQGSGEASLFTTLQLRGSATDPAAILAVSILPASHTFETTQVGKRDTAEFTITSENVPSNVYLNARLAGANGKFLTIGNTSIPKNTTASIKVEFVPSEENTFSAQLEIFDAGTGEIGTLASASLSGAGAGTIAPPEKEGDEYPLGNENPLALMIESFDNQQDNKPLSIEGWKNIAEQNYRAWWGYKFEGTEQNFAAKAIAYNGTNPAAVPYEMWLYTPPLDFPNAASKLFTFRVMGDLMADDNVALLEVYYVEGGENIYKEKIDVEIPQGADFNKAWQPFELDLSANSNNIADVFRIGFRFYVEQGGTSNSVSYYIDDVTWGVVAETAVGSVYGASAEAWADGGKMFISSDVAGSAVLYDISGLMIEKYEFASGISEFQTNLKSGIYLLKIDNIGTKKIVINL
jgi:hypothetical protein